MSTGMTVDRWQPPPGSHHQTDDLLRPTTTESMPTSRKQALALLVHSRRQDGLLTVSQARVAGLAYSTIRRRVAIGRWMRWWPHVLSDAGLPTTWIRRLRAATLELGPDAAVAGMSAARLHDLSLPEPASTEIVIEVDRGRRARLAGLTFHRPATRAPVTRINGMTVVDVAATILQISPQLKAGSLLDCVADAHRRRLIRLDHLRRRAVESAATVAGRGRVLTAVAHLRAATAGDDPIMAPGGRRSELERRFDRFLGANDLMMPVHGKRMRLNGRLIEVDAFWPDQQVVVELDGLRFHATPAELSRDSRRQNLLMAHGLTVLRFGWDDVVHHPESTLRVLTEALEG